MGSDKKIYFGEWSGPYSRILTVDTLGVLKIFAGRDEPSQSTTIFITEIDNPQEIMFDPAGNLFVCNSGDYRILKIKAPSQFTLVAGYASGTSETGNGLPVSGTTEVVATYGIIQDVTGNIFFAGGNATIRTINTSSIINTFAGGGTILDDGGPANVANLEPIGIAWGTNGNMYIADNGQNRVRMIGTGTAVATGIKKPGAIEETFLLFPNPANMALSFQSAGLDGKILDIEITDIIGKRVLTCGTNNLSTFQLNIIGLKSGLYYATISGDNIKITEKFVKE